MQEEMQLMSRCKYSSQRKEVSTQGQALLPQAWEEHRAEWTTGADVECKVQHGLHLIYSVHIENIAYSQSLQLAALCMIIMTLHAVVIGLVSFPKDKCCQ